MKTKLIKAILLTTLFLNGIYSQGCTGGTVTNGVCVCPSGKAVLNGVCTCTNKAASVCGAGQSFNDDRCGCECDNKVSESVGCDGSFAFNDNTCKCECKNKATTTCTSPFAFLDKPDCRCGCPPADPCTCVGATFDPFTCSCKTPVSKCKDVTYDCVQGKFIYPPKPKTDYSTDCYIFDETKCSWVSPVTCPKSQKYIPVYDVPAGPPVCGCACPVKNCARYKLNPGYVSTDPKSKKYICQSCIFPNQYHASSQKCCDCDLFTIKALDPTANNVEVGYLTFSGIFNKKPTDASVVVTPSPLSAAILNKHLNQFVIKDTLKGGPTSYMIRSRISLSQRLFLRWNTDPKFYLSNIETQPGSNYLVDQLKWKITTDPAANSLETYRAKLTSQNDAYVLNKDLTLVPSASIPATQFEFEIQPIC